MTTYCTCGVWCFVSPSCPGSHNALGNIATHSPPRTPAAPRPTLVTPGLALQNPHGTLHMWRSQTGAKEQSDVANRRKLFKSTLHSHLSAYICRMLHAMREPLSKYQTDDAQDNIGPRSELCLPGITVSWIDRLAQVENLTTRRFRKHLPTGRGGGERRHPDETVSEMKFRIQ